MHFLHSTVLLALLALSGCNAASAPETAQREHSAAAPVSISRPVATAANPAADFLQGLDCDSTGSACTAPGFAISGSPAACEAGGTSFGAISDDAPVNAFARFQGTDAVAKFAAGQFLCIHYTAQPTAPDGEPWHYVTAISPLQVPACRTTHCGDPAAQSSWLAARAGKCGMQGDRYSPACPAGWVRGTVVDAYSMGL